jgi:hypothetical protein
MLAQIEKDADDRAALKARLEELLLPADPLAAINQLTEERNWLSRWKAEALIVMSWWDRIDAHVRQRKDVLPGQTVADVALRLIEERDTFKRLIAVIVETTGGVVTVCRDSFAFIDENHLKFLTETGPHGTRCHISLEPLLPGAPETL